MKELPDTSLAGRNFWKEPGNGRMSMGALFLISSESWELLVIGAALALPWIPRINVQYRLPLLSFIIADISIEESAW